MNQSTPFFIPLFDLITIPMFPKVRGESSGETAKKARAETFGKIGSNQR